MWTYRCQVTRVVDGDTLDVLVDVGFHGRRIERLRILGVNAPEVHGETKPAGDAATTFTAAWVKAGQVVGGEWPFTVETAKSDSFGRYLGTLRYAGSDESLADALLTAHQAVRYQP